MGGVKTQSTVLENVSLNDGKVMKNYSGLQIKKIVRGKHQKL